MTLRGNNEITCSWVESGKRPRRSEPTNAHSLSGDSELAMDLFREGADQRTRRRVRPPVLVCMVESVSSVTVFFWLLSPLTESRVFPTPQASNDPMLFLLIKVKTLQHHH